MASNVAVHGRRRHRWPALALVVVLACIVAACSGRPAATSGAVPTVRADVHASGVPAFYTPPSPLPRAPHGTLIRAERVTGVPGIPSGSTVWRVLYHSQTATGGDIAVSGYVIAPGGPVPTGGRPVLAWAHGTTGFSRRCAPSLFSDWSFGGIYLVPDLSRYLQAGFVVAATDYQGLGAPGVAPYLVGLSEGRNVIDAALAAGALPGVHLNHRLVIFGHSQGGQAALFAGQIAPTYAPSLHLLGVVAAAPATGLSTILAVAPVEAPAMAFTYPAAYLWSRVYPHLPVADLLTAPAAAAAPAIVTTGCLGQVVAAITAHHLIPATAFAPGMGHHPVVAAIARANDPGRTRTAAPILVVQGTADTIVLPALTDAFVTTLACPIGDTVDYLKVTGATHLSVPFASAPTIVEWMRQRLAGSPAPSTCGRPGDAATLTPSPSAR